MPPKKKRNTSDLNAARNKYNRGRSSFDQKGVSKAAKYLMINAIEGKQTDPVIISKASDQIKGCSNNKGVVVFRVACQTPSAYYTKGKAKKSTGSGYAPASLKKSYKKNRRSYERRKYYKTHGTRMPKDKSRRRKKASDYVDLHSLW